MLIFFLVLIFLLEGLGLPFGHEISYFLLIISPFFILLFDKTKKIWAPKTFLILGLVFIAGTVISTLKSVNIGSSIAKIFLYPSLLLLSTMAMNKKTDWENLILKSINYLSLFFILVSYLLLIFPQFLNGVINIKAGYSLIYHPDNFHNSLGDFLLIVLIVNFFYWINNKVKKINWFLVALSIPLFFLSFSRSAFAALIVMLVMTVIFYRKKLKNETINYIAIFLFQCLFFVVIALLNRNDTFRPIYNFFHLTKDYLGGRESYFLSAIRSIKDYPFFGIGLNNFIMASHRYNDLIFWWSRTAHNIFLDIFTETGIITGVCFLTLIFLPFKKQIKSVFFYIYLGLVFNFQTFYFYDFYGVLMLFFIILGLIYEEKSTIRVNKNSLFTLALLPIIYIQLLTLNNTLIHKKQYRLANLLNPFNKILYPYLIENSSPIFNFYENARYRSLYKKLFYADSEANEYLAKTNLRYSEKKPALDKLKTSLLWDPFGGYIVERIKNIYLLIKETEGKTKAKKFIENYIKRIKSMDKQKEYQKPYLELINFFQIKGKIE